MYTIEVEPEQIDHIVVSEIRNIVENLTDDLDKRKKGVGMAIFDHDQEKDIKEIKKHLAAAKLMLTYWGG